MIVTESALTFEDQCKALAASLDETPRMGREIDKPEGSRCLLMSDTLAHAISALLRSLPAPVDGVGVPEILRGAAPGLRR
jgi:hypothetical protein